MFGRRLMRWGTGYTVRESPRAKHVRLVVSSDGLTVVVPRGFHRTAIPELLDRKRAWIEQARACLGIGTRRQARRLPRWLPLRAIGERVRVRYQWAQAPWVLPPEPRPGHLVVVGRVDQPAVCRAALRRWISGKARAVLVPWLRRMSHETGLAAGRVQIRNQRSLWASCSADGNISLNQQLLFLPPSLVRYVLIHELCHTVHHNHSRRFWRLVGRHAPDYRVLGRTLDRSWRHVPSW